MSKLQEYLVTVPVDAKGTQTYTVKARSKEDALDRVERQEGTYLEEEFEVQNFKIDQAKAELNK